MKEVAILLTIGKFDFHIAKTAFGLVRKSEHYDILAFIDQNTAEKEAGELDDGKAVDIPVDASIKDFLHTQSIKN